MNFEYYRCDQTTNCLDESDEELCKIIFLKDNYKDTIVPFRQYFSNLRERSFK